MVGSEVAQEGSLPLGNVVDGHSSQETVNSGAVKSKSSATGECAAVARTLGRTK